MCSPGAQALWMRMLCICAKTDGYLIIKGNILVVADMAKQTGWSIDLVSEWWEELSKWEVFSVDGRGRVFCRRMIKDAKKAKTARENGKNGGNPNLRKDEENSALDNQITTNPPTNLPGKPLSIIQRVSEANASSSPNDDGTQVPNKYPEPFEASWKAYPHIKGRSSKPKSLAAWRRLPADIRIKLAAAVARYAREGREPRAECGAPAMERWLLAGRYGDWLGTDPGPLFDQTTEARRLEHFRATRMWKTDWGPMPEMPA